MKIKMNKLNKNTWILLWVLLFQLPLFSQMEDYKYCRNIGDLSPAWYSFEIPAEVYSHANLSLSDIRIFGINSYNDTIEAPYIIDRKSDLMYRKKMEMNLINMSHNRKGYYYTFEMDKMEVINHIKLHFFSQNFDTYVQLEGSQNQKEWYTILEHERMIAIQNDQVDFHFTDLYFTPSKFNYYRLFIPLRTNLNLESAELIRSEHLSANEWEFKPKSFHQTEIKSDNHSLVMVDLKKTYPINWIQLFVKDTFEYYRPIEIMYLEDSVKTDLGWKYQYKTLLHSTISSIGNNKFELPRTHLNQLKIKITNHDNEHIQIDSIHIKSYKDVVTFRIVKPGSYQMYYGNKKAHSPQYDIVHFTDQIPHQAEFLALEKEIKNLNNKEVQATESNLINPIWLWIIIGMIVIVLGGITLKMIKSKDENTPQKT